MRDFLAMVVLIFLLGMSFIVTVACAQQSGEQPFPTDRSPYFDQQRGDRGRGDLRKPPTQKPPVPRRDFIILRVQESHYPPDGLDRFRLKGNIGAAKADLERHGGRCVEIDDRLTGILRRAGETGEVWKVQRVR